MTEKCDYRVRWSEEDKQWAATADQYPSLSWLAGNPLEALAMLMELLLGITLDRQAGND